MRINRIHLRNFGCFDDREIAFEPGLNVIKGPNEAGKSTLHQALMMALLERPTQKKATEPYRAWGAEYWYRLAIGFESDQGEKWELVKDFENNKQELSDQEGNSLTGRDQIQSVIEQTLGTSSLNIFRSTVCVAQDSLTDIAAGRREISQSLEQIITGGDEDVYTESAIKALDDKVREYRRGYQTHAPVNPGPIGQLHAEHEKLQKEVRDYGQMVGEWERNEEALQEAEDRFLDIEKELQPRQALLAQLEKAQQYSDEKEKWAGRETEMESRLAEIGRAEETAATARRQLEALAPVSEVDEEHFQEIVRLEERVAVLRAEKEKADARREEAMAEAAEGPEAGPPGYALPGLITAAGLAGSLAGILLLILGADRTAGGILVALGFLASATGLGWLFLVFRQAERQAGKPGKELPPEFDEVELAAAQAELTAQLTALACQDLEELKAKWRAVQESRRRQQEAEIQKRALIPQGKTKEDLVAGRKIASRKRRDAEEALEDPALQRALALDALEVQSLEGETESLEEEKEEVEAWRIRLAGKLEAPAVTRETLLSAEERLASVEARLARAKRRLATYEVALETMREARRRTLKHAQDELAPRMGDYLEKITLGRFHELEVDSNLNIRVRHPEKAEGMIGPERMSTGTQDQLYLAARLALVDLLFQNARPPIFLDDPFVKFDPERLAAAIEVCRQIAEERQLFLFTCSGAYDGAGHVISFHRDQVGD